MKSLLIIILNSKFIIVFGTIFFYFNVLNSQEIIYDGSSLKNISENCYYFKDESREITIEDLSEISFQKSEQSILNFGITNSNIWLKLKIKNNSKFDKIFIELNNPVIDEVTFYKSSVCHSFSGDISLKKNKLNNHIFDLNLQPGESAEYTFKINSSKLLTLPINIQKLKEIEENQTKVDLFLLFYLGIITSLFIYNIFLYVSLREKAQLLYIFLILGVGLNQILIYGYGANFLFFNSEWLAYRLFNFITIFSGFFTILYTVNFNHTKKTAPFISKIFNLYIIIYTISFFLNIFGYLRIVQTIVYILASTSFLIIIAGYKSYKSGNKSAKYFIIAFTSFAIGVTLYTSKLFGALPDNNFTQFGIAIGSAFAVLLLSFAQANKLNILKEEKDRATFAELKALEQNQTLIRNQKKNLEIEVIERTKELNESKEELMAAYSQLKDTQQSRIEAEKMSSLGQLTAGIAHELNNPINFISNNVNPLRRDVGEILTLVDKYESCIDHSQENEKLTELNEYKEEIEIDYLKEEIDVLLNGINEGSSRTAEIVQNLKIYSHLDSGEKQNTSIVPGLKSTVAILQSNFKTDCFIQTDIPDNISNIFCLPGKLNQVFMNILNNAIHASIEKNQLYDERKIVVKCHQDTDNVYVTINDNGNGIPKKVLEKIFDPFFTTKKVGVGTGLGLSISKTIIESHQGEIKINTSIGNGTEFIVILPRVLKFDAPTTLHP